MKVLLACAQSMLLAACAMPPRETPAPAAPTATPATPTSAPAAASYRPGVGVVESASVVSLASSPAAAGGTAGAPANPTMAYRLKMADGSTQNVVHTGERFQLGERVQVTSDGRLTRP